MEPKNRYYRCAHISERELRQMLRYFALDLSAADAVQLTGLTRKSVNSIFLRIRTRLATACEERPCLPHEELQRVAEEYRDSDRGRRRRIRAKPG